MDLFHLSYDENYDKICGQILLTTKGRLAFFCTFCGQYRNYEEFITHLLEKCFEPNEECTSGDFESLNNPVTKKNNSNSLTEKSESSTAPRNANEGSSIENSKEAALTNANEVSFIENSKEAAQRNDDSKDMETEMELDDQDNIPVVVRDVGKMEFYRSHIAPEERKFECSICGLSFKDRYNRDAHMRRHTNEKNFSCSHCGKKFHTSSETKRHYKFVHEKPGKRFICTECGKGFLTSYVLKNHQKRHNNQKDYICELCNKAFFDYMHLKNHLITHSSKRPFMCEICGASFKTRKTWHTHMKIHQNQRAYKCQFCEASFNVSTALRSHIKSKHE